MNAKKTQNIPIIESSVFKANAVDQFAVGVVGVGTGVQEGYSNEFGGIAALRANVYVSQGYVAPSALDSHGTELDRDDERSVHFALLERVAQNSLARVVGNMRLVIKMDDQPLPVERLRPDVFSHQPAPVGSTEVSRLICQHEDAMVQNYLKWPLFIAGLKYVNSNNLGPVYGLMSPSFTSVLNQQGVPVVPLSQEKYISEIHATKQPVQIDALRLGRFVRQIGDQGIDEEVFSFISPTHVRTEATIERGA